MNGLSRRALPLVLAAVASALLAGCYAGTWVVRDEFNAALTVYSEPPLPQQDDAADKPPSDAHEWIDGYWAFNGAWTWQPGRWALPPRAGARWRAGYWIRRDTAYVWVDGRWVDPRWPDAIWVPGHWERHPLGWGWGWIWVPGHWRY